MRFTWKGSIKVTSTKTKMTFLPGKSSRASA